MISTTFVIYDLDVSFFRRLEICSAVHAPELLHCSDNIYCFVPLHQLSMVICLYPLECRQTGLFVESLMDPLLYVRVGSCRARPALRFVIIYYQSPDSQR